MDREKIIRALEEFTQDYIEGSSIESIIYDNENQTWSIVYYDPSYDNDKFESAEDMINFLHADQSDDE